MVSAVYHGNVVSRSVPMPYTEFALPLYLRISYSVLLFQKAKPRCNSDVC